MTKALVGLLLYSVLLAAPAAAQARAASRADVGFYGGGAWTSSWAEGGEGTRFGIGSNPSFGGFAQYWWTPAIGTRLHLSYVPSYVPEPNHPDPLAVLALPLHNWLYDLNLVVRPFVGARGARHSIGQAYLFLGAGALTANPEGGAAHHCVPPYDAGGLCLSYGRRNSTVGQVTSGLGLPVVPIRFGVSLFAEAGVHVYSSPFHSGEGWTGVAPCPNPACTLEDRRATTGRLVAGLRLGMGGRGATPSFALPAPAVSPPDAALPDQPITTCALVDGMPRRIEALVRPQSGDTVVIAEHGIRRPLRAAFPTPAPTASGRIWFERGEPIFHRGRSYLPLGATEEARPERLARVGEYSGLPLFAPEDAAAGEGAPATVYLPVGDGCAVRRFHLEGSAPGRANR